MCNAVQQQSKLDSMQTHHTRRKNQRLTTNPKMSARFGLHLACVLFHVAVCSAVFWACRTNFRIVRTLFAAFAARTRMLEYSHSRHLFVFKICLGGTSVHKLLNGPSTPASGAGAKLARTEARAVKLQEAVHLQTRNVKQLLRPLSSCNFGCSLVEACQ